MKSGILCAYAAAKWRKEVPFIVALDAPTHLDDGWLNKKLIASIPEGGALRLVSLEVKFGWRDADWAGLVSAAPADWRLTRIKLSGEDHAELVTAIDEAERAMKGQESVEQLLAMPPPSASEIAPYLGTWTGVSWVSVDPERTFPITITFSIEAGHGVAKAINHDAPEEFEHETFKFLRVTKDAIEFGNMNGMFPPGIVTRVGRLQDGKLEGESVFKGVFLKELSSPEQPELLFSVARGE